jgi:hypothetical protein
MTLLAFVFAGFWHFVGTVILLGAAFDGIAKVVRAIRRPRRRLGKMPELGAPYGPVRVVDEQRK